jgi:hypothetical protein
LNLLRNDVQQLSPFAYALSIRVCPTKKDIVEDRENIISDFDRGEPCTAIVYGHYAPKHQKVVDKVGHNEVDFRDVFRYYEPTVNVFATRLAQ